MCNEAARRIALGQLREDFSELRIPLRFPEGAPNMAPLDSIRITDRTVIVRAGEGGEGADLVTRRWSWPGPGGRPVYNYRSDGRDLKKGRCLIPVSGFFEFTRSEDPKAKRKDKWRFCDAAHDWLAIAGLWRTDAVVGEAFTMLTCPPGPDVAPYHSRQVVVVPRGNWAAWLGGGVASVAVCRPSEAGTLRVERVAN